MKPRAILLTIATLTLALIALTACGERVDSDYEGKLNAPYLAQTPPTDSAIVFAPGIVSDGLPNRDIAMTPDGDEIYWTVANTSFDYATIMWSRRTPDGWTAPEVAPFASDIRYTYIEPAISPDGNQFMFASDMPSDGSDTAQANTDLWMMSRSDSGWSAPVNLGAPVNSDGPEFFPSMAASGNLYFTRDDHVNGGSAIWFSEFADGAYQEPVKLGENINGVRNQFNASVAPDESYLIVPVFGRPDSYGGCDYYISYRDSTGEFGPLVNLGEKVNSPARQEWSATVSPDGKYLFFMSDRVADRKQLGVPIYSEAMWDYLHASPANGLSDVYWIATDAIEAFKK